MDYTEKDNRHMDNDVRPMRREDERRPERSTMMHEGSKAGTMHMGRGNVRMSEEEKSDKAGEIYEKLDERICQALSFHSQLADFFCFLGLQGFKRMAEYQYMKECAGKRKMHKRYIDMHHRVLPVEEHRLPVMIPREWMKYTTKDIDDGVLPKYVKMALESYYEWEKETKGIYEDLCATLMEYNMYADYEFLKELIEDVEKECKKAMRLYESTNSTGYDVTAIHSMQDKYHEKYKKKYNDRFTVKNNYPRYEDEESRERRRYTRVGY